MANAVQQHQIEELQHSQTNVKRGEITTPHGTLLVTLIFLLVMAVLWGFMYYKLMQIA